MMGPERLPLRPQKRPQLLVDFYLNQNADVLYVFIMFLIVTQTPLVVSNEIGLEAVSALAGEYSLAVCATVYPNHAYC